MFLLTLDKKPTIAFVGVCNFFGLPFGRVGSLADVSVLVMDRLTKAGCESWAKMAEGEFS